MSMVGTLRRGHILTPINTGASPRSVKYVLVYSMTDSCEDRMPVLPLVMAVVFLYPEEMDI